MGRAGVVARRAFAGVSGLIRRRRAPGQVGEVVPTPGDLRAPGASLLPRDRLTAALALVAQAERLEPALPSVEDPVDFWGRDRVARRPEVPEAVSALLPPQQRRGWSVDSPQVVVLSAPVAADLVVTAKFDIRAGVKLRAAYAERGLTLATQPRGSNGVDGIARCVRAHQVVSVHAPGLVPPLVGQGQLGPDQPYLVERWLDGTPLLTGTRLAAAAPEIIDGLARVHRGHGVEHLPVSEHWAVLPQRWSDTVATGIVPADLGAWVSGLLQRNATIRRSWVHGDLVASNVMRTATGVTLIDWEHSQHAPIMNDGAKLHLFSRDPAGTLVHVLEGFGDVARGSGAPGPAGAYSPAEELALAHANLLARYPRRSAALVGHPRAEVYEKQVRRQVERLAQVRAAA